MNKNKTLFWSLLSFSMGSFLMEFFQATYNGYRFFFYETEMNLNPSLVSLGLSLVSIWKMVSDPLFGYLFDKYSKGNENRLRNIWILIGFLPWVGSVILFYNIPNFDAETQKMFIFSWMVISSLIYGTFLTIFGISFFSSLPTKFPKSSERNKLQGFTGIMSYLGMLMGSLLPNLFISYNVRESYGKMSWIVVLIGLVPFAVLVPSLLKEIKEKPRLRTRLEPKPNSHSRNHEKFFPGMIIGLRQPNYRVILLLSFSNQVMMACVGGSLHYILKYVFKTEASSALILYMGYFSGALIGSFVWAKISEKIQNTKKTYIIQSVLLFFSQIPLIFVRYYTLYLASILLIPYSFCFAGFWASLRVPLTSDVFDEMAVQFKQRKDTTYMGFRSIFFQMGWVFQSAIFGIIHILTGFDEKLIGQPISAERGIIFGFVGVPMIIQIITLIVFYFKYSLTPARIVEVKQQITVLNLNRQK